MDSPSPENPAVSGHHKMAASDHSTSRVRKNNGSSLRTPPDHNDRNHILESLGNPVVTEWKNTNLFSEPIPNHG